MHFCSRMTLDPDIWTSPKVFNVCILMFYMSIIVSAYQQPSPRELAPPTSLRNGESYTDCGGPSSLPLSSHRHRDGVRVASRKVELDLGDFFSHEVKPGQEEGALRWKSRKWGSKSCEAETRHRVQRENEGIVTQKQGEPEQRGASLVGHPWGPGTPAAENPLPPKLQLWSLGHLAQNWVRGVNIRIFDFPPHISM